ncbi:MAG: hypothetical protein KC485_11240 [Gemmatimonadetes bacterium]|nr:hypothetical protein [Gemmatimonadota bacterium]MCB9518496.1 hypothetical protein [Gemmatimonadales bacterium]
MTTPRPHPFDLVFGTIGPERFPAITEAVGDARDLDAFLMAEPAITLLRDLRPDEGLGEAVDDFVIFVHAAWAWWTAGAHTVELDAAASARLLERESAATPDPAGAGAMYIQVAPRRIWARVAEADSHEPLDGWFVLPVGDSRRVVACLGVHPARPGLSVLVAEGPRPVRRARPDGSATFAPRMEGGDTAGLASVDSPEELLLLAWSVPVA